MMESQWLLSLGGGMLVGLSALILMLFNGRVAGISGILAGALQQKAPWRLLFL
ncbi:YeeE/YedE family protein, partial [Aeromonas bivalvium]